MRRLFTLLLSVYCSTAFSQKPLEPLILNEEINDGSFVSQYSFVNSKGKVVLKLDTAKYFICFTDTLKYFAVVGLKEEASWWAIDRNEKRLFQIYNTSSAEPTPDELKDGLIRIIDNTGKIGFANFKGEIVIKPQFEAATTFHNGKAIIGKNCNNENWDKTVDEEHVSISCLQTGYIDKKGKIIEIGSLSMEQMKKKLHWPEE